MHVYTTPLARLTRPSFNAKPVFIALLLASSLTGCASLSQKHPFFKHSSDKITVSQPNMAQLQQVYLSEIGAQFAANSATGEAINPFALRLHWLTSVQDAQLTALVQEALADNPKVKLAQHQYLLAQAVAQTDKVAKKPNASLATSANYGGVLDPLSSATDTYSVRANISWELDLWGKLRAGALASLSDVQAAQLFHKATELSVAAQTAKAYINAITATQQQAIAKQYLANIQKTADITRAFKKEGFASNAEVSLVDIDLANAYKQVHAAEANVSASTRALNLWRGKYPTAPLVLAKQLPALPLPQAAINSALLEQRPDIAAAMQQVNAAFLRSKQAKLARLPSFSLGGSVSSGIFDSSLANLFDPKYLLWNVVGGLTVPLLASSALTVQDDIQAASAQVALSNFKVSALNAFAELEAAKAQLTQLQQDAPYTQQALQAAQLSDKIAMAKFKEGQLDMVELLQGKRTLLNQQLAVVNQQAAMQNAIIDYYLAVGGDIYAEQSQNTNASTTAKPTAKPEPTEPDTQGAWELISEQLNQMFGQ